MIAHYTRHGQNPWQIPIHNIVPRWRSYDMQWEEIKYVLKNSTHNMNQNFMHDLKKDDDVKIAKQSLTNKQGILVSNMST